MGHSDQTSSRSARARSSARELARTIGASFAMLALVACSNEGSDEKDLPITTAGTDGAGVGAAGATVAGTTAAGAMAAGGGGIGSGLAGTSAAGTSAAGTSAAGTSAAGASAAGTSAAGTSAAGAGSAADAGMPDAGEPAMARPAASTLMLPTMMEKPNVEPWFKIYRPTDLNATGQPLPVIVWANGGCFRSDFTWEPLFRRWAAGGFVVLALTEHPQDGPLVQTSIADQRKLIDWTLAEAQKAGGTYAGKLDTTKVIAAGNSCGGITALGLAAEDPRAAAVFVLSGSSAFAGANTQVISKIKVPVGYVVGGSEDIAGANATADYNAFAADLPAMIVSRNMGDHMTVSTDTMILPQVANIALDWMDLALYGTKTAAETLKSPTVCTGCPMGTWTLKSKNLEKLER